MAAVGAEQLVRRDTFDDATRSASLSPSRWRSFWKMLFARTTAYWICGPLSPSKLSASSRSNAMILLRENLMRKYARRDANRLRDPFALAVAQLRVALFDFPSGISHQRIEEVVRLDAEATAPRHLHERPFGVLRVGRRSATGSRAVACERNHLVRNGATVPRPRDGRRPRAPASAASEVRLPDIDDVVDVGSAAERRMVPSPSVELVAQSGPCGRSANTR